MITIVRRCACSSCTQVAHFRAHQLAHFRARRYRSVKTETASHGEQERAVRRPCRRHTLPWKRASEGPSTSKLLIPVRLRRRRSQARRCARSARKSRRAFESLTPITIVSLRRRRWMLFTLALALLPAFAQLVERKDLSYAMALDIATGTLEACKARGYATGVVVVDRGGNVVVAEGRQC